MHVYGLVTAGGVIYVLYDGLTPKGNEYYTTLAAVRSSDGVILWRERSAVGYPLLVTGDVLILAFDSSAEAVRTSDGTPLWSLNRGAAAYSRPALVASSGILYGIDVRGFYAVRIADGHYLWQTDAPLDKSTLPISSMSSFVLTGPLIAGDTLYAGLLDGPLIAVRTSDGAIRWTAFEETPPANPTGAGDTRSIPIAITGGELYVLTLDGLIRVRPSDGAQVGIAPVVPVFSGYPDLTILDGPIYVTTTYTNFNNNSAMTYTALNQNFQRLAQVTIPATRGIRDVVAFARNTFYLGSGNISAVRASDGRVLWNQPADNYQVVADASQLYAGEQGSFAHCSGITNSLPMLRAISIASGKVAWERPLEGTLN